jgi:beta-galactosidase
MKRDSEVKWKVKYTPGALTAKGYKAGQVVAEAKVETTGAPEKVQLIPDRATIDANGEDLSIITVSVADAQNRIVPVAGNTITFGLAGPGRILGVGNGDPSCHEPDTFVPVTPSRSVPIGGWRFKTDVDLNAAQLPEAAVNFNDADWQAVDVNAESGPLGLREKAVFRTHLNVSADDLAAAVVELWFGKIDGSGSVFVNGQKIGGTGDSRAASIYDVKSLLHVGENVIAVTIANYGPAAGLNKGAALRLQDKPSPVVWSRSVFNGLAQIIVQSSKEPGVLKLTASAEGLKPVTISIQTQSVTARPALP